MDNRPTRLVLYALVAIAAFTAGLWISGQRPSATPGSSAAEAILSQRLPDLKSQPQSLSQWRGKVLVVNFWATWCAPCREEIPVFVRLQTRYQDKGLQFVGISIDQIDKTQEFSSSFKMNYPSLIGTFDTVELTRSVGNDKRVLPFTIIFDRKGQMVASEPGGLTEEKLEALLKPLL